MRRNEQQIKDGEEMETIIHRAQVCRIGLSAKDVPYVVPVHFGHKGNCLYFHCATEGKKLDILRHNNTVCFQMDIDHEIVKSAEYPCRWSAKYRSIIGFGKASIIEDLQEKSSALNIVIQHYGGDWYDFSEKELERVCVIRIEISSMAGKKAGY